MPAPLEEWLAHLWPAVALGPLGSVVATQVAMLAPAMLLESISATVLSSAPPNGAPPSSGPETAAPSAPTASPDPFFSPHGSGMSFLAGVVMVLAMLAGLVALARLLVGEDLFSRRWLR